MDKFHSPFYSGGIFHVLSHAVGNELLFRNDEKYRFFLQQYNRYITPIAGTLSYCLLPNHFHFMVRIKGEEIIENYYIKKKPKKDFAEAVAPDFIMECFSNFLNSYAKSYNNMYGRKGALFIDFFKES